MVLEILLFSDQNMAEVDYIYGYLFILPLCGYTGHPLAFCH